MTAQASFFDKRRTREFWNSGLFLNELKRSWPHLVLYTVALLITFVIPIYFVVTHTQTDFEGFGESEIERVQTAFCADIQSSTLSLIAVSAIISVFAACSTVGYLNNKVAVGFYHSLPISREGLLSMGILVKSVCFAAAFLISASTGMLLVARIGFPFGLFFSMLHLFGEALLMFLLYYSVTLFAAMLTGTGATRALMALFITFAPLGIYGLFFSGPFFENYRYYDISFYLSDTVVGELCPALSILFLRSGLTVGKKILYLAVALILLALSYLLYAFRKSEAAGVPVLTKPVNGIVRYSCMFIGTLLGGMVFDDLFSAMYLGYAIGGLITFMLVNMVLHKSTRAIFKNLLGGGIFAVAFALTALLFYADPLGLDAAVPPAALTSSVEIKAFNDGGALYPQQTTLTVSDSDDKKAIIAELMETIRKKETDYDPSLSYDSSKYPNVRINTVSRTYFGIPIAKEFYVPIDYAADLLEACGKTDEYREAHDITEYDFSQVRTITVSGIAWDYTIFGISHADSNGFRILIDYLADRREYYSDPDAKDTVLGYIRLNQYNGTSSLSIPIRINDHGLLEILNGSFASNRQQVADLIAEEGYSEIIKAVTVTSLETGKRAVITGKSKLEELVPSFASLVPIGEDSRLLMQGYEGNYAVTIELDKELFTRLSADYYGQEIHFCTVFPKGELPEYIAEKLK